MIALSWLGGSLTLTFVPLRHTIPDEGPMQTPALILAIVICVLGLGSFLLGASESVSSWVSRYFGFDEESQEQGRIRRRRRTRRR